jgi:hypothetical protein
MRLTGVTANLRHGVVTLASCLFFLTAPAFACSTPSAIADKLDDLKKFGRVEITSTCGGKHSSGSMHYKGKAVDFRVHGNWKGALAALKDWDGGFAHYCHGRGCGLFHLDVGSRRRWKE